MKKYNNIIVPTDGSVNSKRALEHAVVIASSLGATITLVYVANIVSVISNFDQIPNASGYVTEQVALDMEEEGKGILDEFAKSIPQNIEVKSVFEVGSPGPAVGGQEIQCRPHRHGQPRPRAVERLVHGFRQQLCRHPFGLPCIDR